MCGAGGDPFDYMWFLAWWPHALLHGQDPFITHALFAPDRVNLGAVDVIPGPALLLTPVTLAFGPLVSYNVLALAAPVLAAAFGFLLCRYVSRSAAAGVVGGYIFGFSPYMLGHLQGHLDLMLIFPVPAAVYLVLRLMNNEIAGRRFIALMTVTLAFLFLCSQEIAATFVLVGALTLALAYLFAPSSRANLGRVLKLTSLAGAAAVVIDGVFIYAAMTGEVLNRFFNHYSDTIVADPLGFFVPTDVLWVGHAWFASLASKFSGGTPENGVYVGIPFALLIAYYVISRWRRPSSRILLVTLALVLVASLGSHLHVAGNDHFHIGSHHTIPLPWLALSQLPFARQIAPARFGVYLFLIVALIVAMLLGQVRGRRAAAAWMIAALGVLALVPNIGSGAWKSAPDNPTLFTADRYQSVIGPSETVLALPFADAGDSMLWQAETGFRFKLAEGYVGALLPSDYVASLQSVPGRNPTLPPDPNAVRTYIVRRHVAIVVVDGAAPGPWPGVLAAAGLRPQAVGGVLLYRTAGGSPS